jgi:protein-disulfide isomerase
VAVVVGGIEDFQRAVLHDKEIQFRLPGFEDRLSVGIGAFGGHGPERGELFGVEVGEGNGVLFDWRGGIHGPIVCLMDDSSKAASVLAVSVSERDHSLGPAEAPITIVEYGDYECPDCLNAVPILAVVRKELGERARFVFRHFPQNSIHPHASTAAEAAEAAGDQGKFWQMHEALFKNQQKLTEIDISHLALTVGLEIYRFEVSRNQERHSEVIRWDYEGGVKSGVRKTPTLFINGQIYAGAMDAGAIVSAANSLVSTSVR